VKQRAINTKTKMAAAAEQVATSHRLKRAVDALEAHYRDPEHVEEPRLGQIGLFTEEDVRSIVMIARKQAGMAFSERHFVSAMAETTPVLARPRTTDAAVDFWRLVAQPEISEELWPEWKSRTGTRGRDPGYWAKAILMMTAGLGISAHFNDNHDQLSGSRGAPWRALFDWLERTAAAATGRQPQPLAEKSYEKTCEQINLITDPARNGGALTAESCVGINRKLCDWLRSIYPEFGVNLSLDAMLFKAWVKQVGVRSPEEEAEIRKRAPNATSRYIGHGNGGLGRFARGYYLVVLSDLATGVPVIWCLLPAGKGYTDHHAILTLLKSLFEMDDEFPVERIVADRAWNSAECVSDCATRYGIHLISGLDAPTESRKVRDLNDFDSEVIAGYDGVGNAYCRQHGVAMKRVGSDFVGRKKRKQLGLKPGETSNGTFRLRFKCSIGGGICDHRADMPMSRDWNGFSYYPHSMGGGREDLQAMRLALYARRNTSEAIFGALKLGHKLGLESADRTHTANENTVETLVSLGLLSRTALVTANERILRGEMPVDPPPDLLAKLR
jgi:hypothetical protein